jgi:predicted DNA-binding transcriptional regulator YafY
MRADRLLSEILMLQLGKPISGRAMAKRLEISERTVHRDMESLSAAGVPVFALRGARGGWQLEEGWRMHVPGLEESELQALLMAQPRVLGDARLAAAAERALNKLIAALPGDLHQQAASIQQRLYVDAEGWRESTEDLSRLPVVQEAVSRDRKLKILYRKTNIQRLQGGESLQERIVDPLGLVAKGAAWYLVANTAAGFRTFRVSRMAEATVLGKACVRPKNFDLPIHWRSTANEFQKQWGRYEAVLLLRPAAAEHLRAWRNLRSLSTREQAEEWTKFAVQFDNENEACFVIQGLQPNVVAISPKQLRDRVTANLAAAMRHWAES